jgi:hypothetical protein
VRPRREHFGDEHITKVIAHAFDVFDLEASEREARRDTFDAEVVAKK